VDIDMTVLRALEREKEISFDILVEAIEQALLTAYHKTAGVEQEARVHLDRKTGHVTVLASETDEEGATVTEYDDTPAGFGRIAATTAKQIILQRLRDAEDERRFGEFSGTEGDIVSGIIQQGRDPQDVMVDLGKLEAVLPAGERVPGERYDHGTRIKCLVISVRKGMRGPQVLLSRSHPNLVKKLFALEVPEIADGTVEICTVRRSRSARLCPGSTPRGPVSARWVSACATSCMPCTARRSTSWTGWTTRRPSWRARCLRPGCPGWRSSTSRLVPLGSSYPTSSSPWPLARRGRTLVWPPG